MSIIINVGLFLTFSKVLPTYKPTIPKMKIITPDKNQIENIKLVHPVTAICPLKYLKKLYMAYKIAKNEIPRPSLMVNLNGLSEKDRTISRASFNSFLTE